MQRRLELIPLHKTHRDDDGVLLHAAVILQPLLSDIEAGDEKFGMIDQESRCSSGAAPPRYMLVYFCPAISSV